MSKRSKSKAQDGTTTLLTPSLSDAAISLANPDTRAAGRIWRKRILPASEINYEGRKVVFDQGYHESLIDSFNKRALDQVPFQLADKDNAHTMDPERTRGEIVGMSLATEGDTDGPGLYANIRTHTPEADQLLASNPSLGVSCQIREGRQRVDGAKFPRVLRHVLGTLDPRVTNLGQWRAVSLSNDEDGQVMDLTNADYEEITVARTTDKTKDTDVNLSVEDAEAALSEALGELTDEDLTEFGSADLSNTEGDGHLISLAAEVESSKNQFAALRAELAESRWQTERTQLQGLVPKAILDLAEPLMAAADVQELSLSNSDGEVQKVNPAEVVRNILAECKALDLSHPGGLDLADPDEKQAEKAFVDSGLAAWDATSGPVS